MSKYNPISEERKKERKDAVIKELKSLIFPLILLALFAVAIVFIMTYQAKTDEVDIVPVNAYTGDGKEIVLENSKLKMVMDSTTTSFDITVKSTGKVWHSAVMDSDNDSIAINSEKNKLKSNLLLTYSNDAGLDTTLDSYTYSSLNGIYDIEAGDDYISIDYSIGKIKKEYIIPPVIEADRLDELLSTFSVTDKEGVKQFYKKYDINKLGKKDNKEELLQAYPILETTVIYVYREGAARESALKRMQELFEEAGYTYEEFLEDKALSTLESVDDSPVFNVTVKYTLDGDDLVVTVPLSSMDHPKTSPISTLAILPFFGAGSKDDQGYMLIPEGGGSIINFNNGKISQSSYYANLYGWDMAIERESLVHNTLANMNVYGISDLKNSVMCTIESGSAYASIKADISGRTNSYNYVYPVYSLQVREKYDMGAQANQDMYVYLDELPDDEDIVERFTFVDSGSYVDMAKVYRDYLLENYDLTLNTETSTPVAIEMVGAIDKVKQIVGIPVSRPLALTTYEEAAEMITDINSVVDGNLSVKYTGWCNGGVAQNLLKDVDTIWALGSRKDLIALSNTAKDLGVDLYLDGIAAYEHNSNLFDGFFSYRDAAKYLSRKRAALYIYSDVTYAQRDGTKTYYLLHPSVISENVKALQEYTDKIGTNVSLQDIGKDLSSDFYRKNYTSREAALVQQVGLISDIKNNNQKLMINAGNAYAAPYADFITNMDLKGSEYTIIDEVVPFYEIALHGYVDYSGYPINTGGNTEEQILEAAAYGAGLSFSFMKESSFTIQKTLYTEYYASDYDLYKDTFEDIYTRYNAELGHTYNQTIENHDNLSENVSVTEYADGTKVYVNFGFLDFDADGVTVPARDYLVVR